MKKCFCVWVLMAVILVSSRTAYAQHTLHLNSDEHDIVLSPFGYIYKGSAPREAIDILLQADSTQFVRHGSIQDINYGVDRHQAWSVFHIQNDSDQENWILKMQQACVDTARLYVVRQGKLIERLPMTGHYQVFSDRPVRSLPFAYPISIKKGEVLVLYLFTMREYGRHAAVLNLQTKDYFESYEFGFNVALGFVSGMTALASLVGFFLFLFVRQKLYIYYSVYAMSFLFVVLADSGFTHAILYFPHDQTIANGFTMVFYYWMGGCLGIFTIELLQLKHEAKPWVYWAGIIMSYSFCGVAMLLLIPGLPHSFRHFCTSASYYWAFINSVYILYALSISFDRKEPIVYFYMAGFYFTSVVAMAVLLSDFQLLNLPFQNKDILYLTPLVEILCVAVGIGIHFSRTFKERVNVQLALNQTQDQIITIQEDERRRIAQDLHDDVGNSLAAIKNMVKQKRESASVEKEIDNIIDTIRLISHDLMPINFDEFSLVDIVSHTVNKFKDHPTLALEFSHTGKSVKIKSLTELVIYRIVNELITNIFKHSNASKAFVQLIYQEKSLVVMVEDNGDGIRKTDMKEGIGLRSIRLRAEYIRAQFKIESDDKGTLIILEVPYENIN